MKKLFVSSFLIIALNNSVKSQNFDYRHPFYWPFAETSIWNTPIGEDAVLVNTTLTNSQYIGVDEEYFIVTDSINSSKQAINIPTSWEVRWPGTEAWWQDSVWVPNNLIIPDATLGSTPNACATILLPSRDTIVQLEPACRVVANSHIVGYRSGTDYSLYSDGTSGSHYGSCLSAMGGSIRLGELTGLAEIRHALKLNVWGSRLYYSSINQGFRWPALCSDNYASTGYLGSDPNLMMGTLLAIPRNISAAQLGISTQSAAKILIALQNYGAYITDDSGWNAYDWCMEIGVIEETQTALGEIITGDSGSFFNDMQILLANMKIVNNNTSSTVGGGGIPVTNVALNFCTEILNFQITGNNNPLNNSIEIYSVPNIQKVKYAWVITGGVVQINDSSSTVSIIWSNSPSKSLQVSTVDKLEICKFTAQLNTVLSVFENEPKDEVTIFPIPSDGILTVKQNSTKHIGIEIHNVLGELIFKTTSEDQQTLINLSNNPKGIYFIRIIDGNKNITNKKLIIK